MHNNEEQKGNHSKGTRDLTWKTLATHNTGLVLIALAVYILLGDLAVLASCIVPDIVCHNGKLLMSQGGSLRNVAASVLMPAMDRCQG